MPTVELKNKLKNKNRNANEQRCRVVCFNIDKVNKIQGMDITFVTNAETDKEAKSLLTELGLPFKKN